jgi:hypothetical protein
VTSAVEQPPGSDSQGGCQPVDNLNGGVARAPFEIADIGAVQSDFERERFLRQPPLGAERAQVTGEAMTNIHTATVAVMSSVSLQTMSDNALAADYPSPIGNTGNDGMIGRLERVPLREVWMHEAHDFTQWLELNIDILNDALDLEIVNVDREQAADIHGRQLIIENQLEKSDHDHLGKLITYLTALGAKGAIWIVKDPRPEHVAAVQWLNQALDTDFYMVKVEAVKILDSAPAPLFTLIVGPSREAKEVGQTRKDVAERYAIRNNWWTALIARSGQRTRLHKHITPGDYSWIGVSAGYAGINYNYTVTQTGRTAELYIDRGRGAEEDNHAIYQQLSQHRDEIEAVFGGPLSWEALEGKRACRIRFALADGGYRSPDEQWPMLHDTQIDAMVRLEKAMKPFVQNLRAGS